MKIENISLEFLKDICKHVIFCVSVCMTQRTVNTITIKITIEIVF